MADFVIRMDEATSGRYTGVLKDDEGEVLNGGAVSTLTLTLYDLRTDTIINSRDEQNVLNTNGVTVDGSGNFTWTIGPLDTPIVNSALAYEQHRAYFRWTYNGGTSAGSQQVTMTIRNMHRFPVTP